MSFNSLSQNDGASGTPLGSNDNQSPTTAAFSPKNISGNSLTSKQRSTIIVHRKSPLLVATPPAITRALAYSHPFLLPLNQLAGLLSWTTGDTWESFLLVAMFWAVTLYGSAIILWGGPILVVVALMLGLYSRRFSPLSSTHLTGEKHGHNREVSDGGWNSKHYNKTLDEVVETLREFTTRCNVLLEPLKDFTDFLSSQRTATSTTTRPALMALLTRIIFVTPVWILLTLPPFRLITMQRVIITVGTIILTWHSTTARIFRVLLWKSLTIRHICSVITGLNFSVSPTEERLKSLQTKSLLSLHPFRLQQAENFAKDASGRVRRRADSSGVRFTFILYENQRRWLGIGWTYSLFAYERPAWSDEHLNPAPSKDDFELPEVEGSNTRWRWVNGSEWHVDGVSAGRTQKKKGKPKSQDIDDGGWIYYDNKWNDGRRGQDGWGRYTRRRKWCRDAELVEITPSIEITPPSSPLVDKVPSTSTSPQSRRAGPDGVDEDENARSNSSYESNSFRARKRRWFGSVNNNNGISNKYLSTPPSGLSASSLPSNFDGRTPVGGSRTELSSSLPKRNSENNSNNSPRHARRVSEVPSSSSGSGNGSRATVSSAASRTTSDGTSQRSQTLSTRERELEREEEEESKWGPTNERTGRGVWGLGDDAHMNLS